MPWKSDPTLWDIVVALCISAVSGFIAIANAVAGGQKVSVLWVVAQIAAALLAGWLAWDIYPTVADRLPDWCSQPILTSFAAHFGGKAFSTMEKLFSRRYGLPTSD